MPHLRLYNERGFLSGHYVYTLICQEDGGPLYIKVGMSSNPVERFSTIRNGNPLTAITLAALDLPHKDVARLIEKEIHLAAQWCHHSLEWFKLPVDQFDAFKACCAKILDKYSKPGRPRLRWTHLDCAELVKISDARKLAHFRNLRRKGAAYIDFVASGGRRKTA